jgi:hypothetical protein
MGKLGQLGPGTEEEWQMYSHHCELTPLLLHHWNVDGDDEKKKKKKKSNKK